MVARLQGKLPGQQTLKGKLNNATVDNSKILEYDTRYDFPTVGKSHTIYIAKKENALYRWDDEALLYFSCSGDIEFDEKIEEKINEKVDEKFNGIELITGGSANG